jgi:hypothetical protein
MSIGDQYDLPSPDRNLGTDFIAPEIYSSVLVRTISSSKMTQRARRKSKGLPRYCSVCFGWSKVAAKAIMRFVLPVPRCPKCCRNWHCSCWRRPDWQWYPLRLHDTIRQSPSSCASSSLSSSELTQPSSTAYFVFAMDIVIWGQLDMCRGGTSGRHGGPLHTPGHAVKREDLQATGKGRKCLRVHPRGGRSFGAR